MSLKTTKEQFVSNLGGSDTQEIINIMMVFIPIYATSQYIQESQLLMFVMHFVIPLLMVTLYVENKGLLYIFSILPILFMENSFNPLKTRSSKQFKKTKKNFLTAYRAHMLIMTTIAILGVDFNVFPRKLAKVETWGTSLMDLGVGSFIFSGGIVARVKPTRSTSKASMKSLIFRKSNILFVLGLLRLIFVKNLEYQEHVTEYGVHWNFFITLGLLPLVHDFIIQPFIGVTGINRGILALTLASSLELWLNKDERVLKFLIEAERNNLLSSNREGIYSFLGYVAIFLMGQEVGGSIILHPRKTSNDSKVMIFGSYKVSNTIALGVYTVLCWTLNQLVLHVDKYYISRRFANLPYVLWVVSYNLGFLTAYSFVDDILIRESTDSMLTLINDNGLLLFLLANILTGLINMSMNTLEASSPKSIIVLLAYCMALYLGACILNKFKIKL
ncbi:related to GPI-anchored wall transfer protein 1 [Hanseniaspora guilliermondii]|uniref:GPI-anchored wall transfer protein n=1 Tax=Hanseniaspora guilliermondii TaxID=56406 RepID=A0A1L0B4U7_9ASCO|nr:related to GPI-anchored wall transfer protein 1 [Hanseniaspora guilliermondii]